MCDESRNGHDLSAWPCLQILVVKKKVEIMFGIAGANAQTAHSSRKPQAGTPSRAGTPVPFPLKEVQEWGGGVPAGRGSRRRGVGVPARGVLRSARGQEAWEYHEPGPPNEPGPLASPEIFTEFRKRAKALSE